MFQENYIPIAVRIKLFFSDPIAIIGVLFLFVGVLFTLLFGFNTDYSSIIFKFKKSEITTGQIVNIEETTFEENESRVFKYFYTYSIDGEYFESVSFDRGGFVVVNQEVQIEYLKDNPSFSRIIDMRMKAFSLWTSFVVIFPFIGLIFSIAALRNLLKSIKILKFGKLAQAKFVTMTATNVEINGRRVMKVFLKYQDFKGEEHEVFSKTTIPELASDETEEKIVYNTNNPEEILIVDTQSPYIQAFIEENIH